MGLTLFEAHKRMRNPLAIGILKAIVTEDELFSLLPFVPKGGNAFGYRREKALPTAEFVSPTHTSLTESTATWDQVNVPIREISTDFDIRNYTIAQQGGQMVVAEQLIKKSKAIGRLLANKAINGAFVTTATLVSTANPFAAVNTITAGPFQDSDRFGPGELKYTHTGTLWQYRAPGDRDFGTAVAAAADGDFVLKSDNPSNYITVNLTVASATADGQTSLTFSSTTDEPDGLKKMIPSSQTRAAEAANGDDISFEIMDELIDSVKCRRDLVFVCNSAVRRKIKALMRSTPGGLLSSDLRLPSFNADGATVERPVLSYDGIPILRNDWVLSDETVGATTNASSLYCVSLSQEGADNDPTNPEGFYAGAFGGESLDVEADPMDRMVLGLHLLDVGHLEGKNARRWRANWYGGFALGSELAAARASGIKTA